MTRQMDDAFRDWTDRAFNSDILEAAKRHGAVMKKAGGEWKGPCPTCQGTDRFSCNPTRNKWFCRGAQIGGLGSISMVQHIAGLPFKAAVESITGDPCPSGGPARPLSPEEQAARNRQRLKMEDSQRLRKEQEEAYQESTTAAALRIWESSKPIDGTLAQTYLYKRGIPPFDTDVLRFHPALPYPNGQKLPALICRVDGMDGSLCAVWRIYLSEDGRKASVDNAKLGLGPAGGGAVRLGGIGPKVGIAEGLESALGFWFLTGRKYPVLASLSTSGMVGIELPLCVEKVVIAPDGDRPLRKQGEEFVPAVPAGRKAAQTLRDRLVAEGLQCVIAAEPSMGADYNDLWQSRCREVA